MSGILHEIRRRQVHRVAIAYLAGSWLLIQILETVFPIYGLNEAAIQWVILALLIGFLPALALSWAFDWSPQGIRSQAAIDEEPQAPRSSARTIDRVIIAVLSAAVLFFAFDKFLAGPEDVPLDRSGKSIAVLPFESRSTDPSNLLFADGIHDDLLVRLSSIGALRVISRTSVMEYRDSDKNVRQIGRELGVGTVLEGAVQRIGDSVRITAQLIDAATDESIWAASYDRQLSAENLFAIQTDISTAISDALKAELTEQEQVRIANVPTENMEAYRLYTLGRANVNERRLDSLEEARRQFERATELDPQFAEAWVGLADSVLLLFNNHLALTQEQAMPIAGAALDRAMALDPNLADAYATLGLMKQKIWEQSRRGPALADAERAFRRAIELNPNDVRAVTWLASTKATVGQTEEAIELYQAALRLDPLARTPFINLPALYAAQGQNDRALELFLEAVDVHPDWPSAYQNLAMHLHALGRFDESVAWGVRGIELSTDPLAAGVIAASYVEFGDYDKAFGLYVDMPPEHPMYEMGPGLMMLVRQDFPAATREFVRLVERSEEPPQFLLNLVAACAVLARDFATAREYLERQHPDFLADARPTVDRVTLNSVVMYAFVLQQLGERQRAQSLLAAALPVVRELPRTGIAGHGFMDAQILALQGKSFEALAAMRGAVDEGVRGSVFFNGWPLALDPYLDSIRSRPEFDEIVAEIDAAVDAMRKRVLQAEQSGNWDDLRALAGD